jgi:hypothetical protein
MVRISAVCGECKKYYQGETCPNCSKEKGDTVNFIADFHEEYYDHGLGTVVKSRQHRKALMKERGLEEVGNEWKYVDPTEGHKRTEKRIQENMRQANEEALRRLHHAGID